MSFSRYLRGLAKDLVHQKEQRIAGINRTTHTDIQSNQRNTDPISALEKTLLPMHLVLLQNAQTLLSPENLKQYIFQRESSGNKH